MKHTLLSLLFISLYVFSYGQTQSDVSFDISPSPFEETDEITITVSNLDADIWGSTNGADLYLWTWYFDTNGNQAGDSPTNGDWSNSNEAQKFTNNGDGTYSFTMTPTELYQDTGIGQLGMLVKSDDGSQQSQDELYYVGAVTVVFNSPNYNPVIVESGGNLSISAYMQSAGTTQVGAFEVLYNNVSVATGQGFPTYSTTLTNVTESGTVTVIGTPSGSTESGQSSFEIIIASSVVEALPEGMENGINYDSEDATKATLVLDAPNKDFVYAAGSFNDWNPYSSTYLMKKDASSSKFWIELNGLTSGEIYTYQYWTYTNSPATNSPSEVKTADPFSTLVLSPWDDPYIPEDTYPNLPDYPAGQSYEVTVLQTAQPVYDWQVTNFTKPKKEDLVIYEVLIRDFDSDRNFQDIIDKIDYFKDLNVNAIQLMPVMEFEGNESWGYNTSFHMALDKFYGTEAKLKELIDTCHQNGIAVILDIALNHAFGRNPMVRMWSDNSGNINADNPYFNQTPAHSYNVGSDFNHQQERTQYYSERVVEHWIEEFKIDGIRWDLTKGFTQNCANNEGCTNDYNADRVAILKEYADFSWDLDANHYVIFEHLGTDWDANNDGQTSLDEEIEWANYHIGEGKGIMLWGNLNHQYNELTMGYTANITSMGHTSRGFDQPRLVGYAESHDEERLMFKNIQYGNSNGSYDVTELNTALERMSALGAVSLTIPGPKMIWHFGELGMENSIYTCNDGTVNLPDNDSDGTGDCKLDTKPQPQWSNNWLGDANRSQIYEDWARINALKIQEDVFEGNYTIESGNLTPKIYIWDDTLPSTELKNVVILANFDVVAQNMVPNFPYTGTWYDLMDNTGSTTMEVSSTTATINMAPGTFKIYGNLAATLSIEDHVLSQGIKVYPNPTNNSFQINKATTQVAIYDITGKLVKSFSGDFQEGHGFDISNLMPSIYMVKLKNEEGQIATSKLIKL
ncbi:alpha-amylase family glycosyl hydrolase [Mangrovimonas sp. DI 80]|uniref:alpha-amylase family glycosyl hydrolase n=1 Tax=Mangrovimonas sp. DI 80 TaxID=1779330 RepID=UPI0009754D65|nr:alpha-amylase family glycosyl hydrolase [Mangrovimonas sp. DI 80]OMP31891.1 alpha-amylase [Mangrovimonas sp. DI 80]